MAANGISLGGLNLDVKGIVAQLMQVESRPLVKLQDKNTQYNSQLSELGRLKSKLSEFQSAMENLSSLDKFERYATSTSEDSSNQSFTATADKDAVAGKYSIDVKSLATVDKWGQDPAGGVSFTSTETISATSTLDFTIGSDNYSIDVNGKTISEIRDAINTATQGKSPAATASIIQTDTDQYQFVMTATDTGVSNKISFTNNDAFSALSLSNINPASDASVVIDGYTVSSASNTITDALQGVTLNLLQANPNATAATLDVTRDVESVKSSINEFITTYNSLMSSIDVYKTGALKGDSSLNTIASTLRNEINRSADTGSTYNYLAEIGVTTNQDGELTLDSDAFDKAVENNYEEISKLFATTDKGVAYRLEAAASDMISFDGLIKIRENTLNSQIRSNEDDQVRMQYRLDKKEEAYLKQFSKLDTLIGQVNSNSTALAGQLAALPGYR